MADQYRPFTFESKYDEADDAGGRVDVVMAYNERQAQRLVAMQMIEDNEWEDRTYTSLEDAFKEELTVLHWWEDNPGEICPSCSNMSSSDTLIEDSGGTIRECNTCHFQWVPLGRKLMPDAPTCAEIDAELDEFEATINGSEEEDDSCDNCGNTDLDGSNQCVDCGTQIVKED